MRALIAPFSVLPLLFFACGDKEGGDSADSGDAAVDASWTGVRDEVLVNSCGFSSCHGSGTGGLTLDADTTPGDLVGVESAAQPGSILVVAGDSEGSYLMQKLRGDSGIAGNIMPPSGALDAAAVARVAAWIDAGANE